LRVTDDKVDLDVEDGGTVGEGAGEGEREGEGEGERELQLELIFILILESIGAIAAMLPLAVCVPRLIRVPASFGLHAILSSWESRWRLCGILALIFPIIDNCATPSLKGVVDECLNSEG